MNGSPNYELVFDLAGLGWRHGPLVAVAALVLVVALVVLRRQRRRGRPLTLPGFFVVAGALMLAVGGLTWVDHQRLLAALQGGRTQVVEGVVQSHAVQQLASYNPGTKRYDRRTWEAFLVGEVAFGFTRDGSVIGFTNSGDAPVDLADGEVLRVHFVEDTPGDFASRRIVRLERKRLKHDNPAVQHG